MRNGFSSKLMAASVMTALAIQTTAPATYAIAGELTAERIRDAGLIAADSPAGSEPSDDASDERADTPVLVEPGESSSAAGDEAPSEEGPADEEAGSTAGDASQEGAEGEGGDAATPAGSSDDVTSGDSTIVDNAGTTGDTPSDEGDANAPQTPTTDESQAPVTDQSQAGAQAPSADVPTEPDQAGSAETEAQPPIPGADAPVSPTNASTRAGVSIYDFLTQDQIDEALVSMMARDSVKEVSFASLLAYADQYCGLPYVWGGRDPVVNGGFDCSGLVIWTLNNVAGMGIDAINTNASMLYSDWCTPISREEAQPGDLVFFKGTYGGDDYISHVGIYCGNGIMLDAGDPIGYDNIDIIKTESGAKAPILFGRIANLDVATSSEDGWREEGNKMYYYEQGKKVTGEKEIYGGWYFFDPSQGGAMATGFVRLTGEYLANGPKTVYYDRFGRMVTGEVEVDGNWYYLDPAQGGALATGFVRLSGEYLANGPKTVYYDEQGRMVTGEVEVDGNWYYLDPSRGGAMATGFVTLTGAYLANGPKTVYYDRQGRMVTGEVEANGGWYYFDPARGGAMATGFVRLTGDYLANGPKTVFYDENGCMVLGERQVGGAWYYLDPAKGGAMATGFVNLTGGYLAQGSKIVYYDSNGRMVNGSCTIGGVSCYFDPALGGALTTPRMSAADVSKLSGLSFSRTEHKVPYVDQNAEGAVMGCEAAALYMSLRGQGALSGTSFADFLNAIPIASDNNPNNGFVGNPWAYEELTGIYQSIYPAALASWGSNYGSVNDISGTSTLGIAQQIQAGKNVVAYVTIDFEPVQWKSYFFGNAVENAHVVAVTGFDPATARFQVADPNSKGGTQWIDWNTFDAAYSAQKFAVSVG